jgi:protein gp37
MADRTRIQWADATWNPMTGCTPVSEACEHCYAERMNRRFHTWENCDVGEGCVATSCSQCKRHFIPQFHPNRLDKPLHWRKPRRIFVCSMSDLFHEAFTDEQIGRVFRTICEAGKVTTPAWGHTWLILTKRTKRVPEWLDWAQRHEPGWFSSHTGKLDLGDVWFGCTIECQDRAPRVLWLQDQRIPHVFVSLEPLLGPVDMTNVEYQLGNGTTRSDALRGTVLCQLEPGGEWMNPDDVYPRIEHVILGGETGPGARPMNPEWAIDVWRQCKAAGTPFFWKAGSKGVEYEAEMTATHEVPYANS